MKSSTKAILGLLAFAVLLVGAYLGYQYLSGQVQPAQPPAQENSSFAPDFSVEDVDGLTVRLSDMRGKPVVLNFWASWCPPCRAEMPDFEKVYQELGGEIEFMMVNMLGGIQDETKNSAMAFIAGQGYSFPVYFDSNHE